MRFFELYRSINNLILNRKENEARVEVIKVLDLHQRHNEPYNELINNLIRQVGLYPYMKESSSSWQERFIYESFKTDIGCSHDVTLHREQSSVLKKLISGDSLAISAPTSFGKSFIIDAFIAIKKPTNVMIIVPTIALSDETRRRLQKKFSTKYKIITTTDASLDDNNIFIFPQERASNYIGKIESIDLLVVDEFYKASRDFDKERSSSLQSAILKLSEISRQKYFLAPNISKIKDNVFTKGMEIKHIDFNTVYLKKYDKFNEINGDEEKKSDCLIDILAAAEGKTLIYAGTYSNIDRLAQLIITRKKVVRGGVLDDFSNWLKTNYSNNWALTNLIQRRTGVHTGQMHRSLSQIQVKLFEEQDGLKNIISTSSIIEGVNTSAQNVVIWKNRNGRSKLNDFTYRNIIGRSGRMFKHFVGHVYILDAPPKTEDTQLSLELTDDVLYEFDCEERGWPLSNEQLAKIIQLNQELDDIFGVGVFKKLQESNAFESADSFLLKDMAVKINAEKRQWASLAMLNSSNPEDWESILYRVILFNPGGWETEYNKLIGFIKVLSGNWHKTIPELLEILDDYDVGIDLFFKLERLVSFKLSALIKDVSTLYEKIHGHKIDVSVFYTRLSNVFLPPLVYSLEEYGLPRMISKKINGAGVLNLECLDLSIHDCLNQFLRPDVKNEIYKIKGLSSFDYYILDHFYDGIESE